MRSRSLDPEILDGDEVQPEALRRTLGDVEKVNRWLGGTRCLRLHLEGLEGSAGPVRVLDVGTGNAGTLLHLRERVADRWSFVGVDSHSRICAVAGERCRGVEGVSVVRADGLRLPFPDQAFDAAVCTLTLHHLDDEDAVALVREMARVSLQRVVVNDLERCPGGLAGARLLSWTVWRRSPVTRHDGPLSVRRAFTPDELLAVGRAGGLAAPRVTRHPAFRLALVGRPVPQVQAADASASS